MLAVSETENIYIFFQKGIALVKKTETMLIVYKNKLNDFAVCNCNSIFVA